MKRCMVCNKCILLSGEEICGEIYCGAKCRKKGLLRASQEFLSEDIVQERIRSVHGGACPKCGGSGPNDLQWHYTIWSAFVLTSHKDIPAVCCKKCGIRKKLYGLLFSGLLGWWGLPFGVLLTPIQVGRNLVGLFRLPSKDKVSRGLDETIRLELGTEVLSEKARIEWEERNKK